MSEKNSAQKSGNGRSLFDYREFLKHSPEAPGVYCMRDHQNSALYVGKAVNLKQRLASYFNDRASGIKTKKMVEKIANIDVTVTTSETEALLLEQTLIKKYKPPYNILLRDDKSYPYICLSDHHYPRLYLYRGNRKKKGKTFGPFPGANAARETMKILQKVFRVRQCEDSFFANRKRPCLQYQINRCKAPCTAYVTPEEYREDVELSIRFLSGKSQDLILELVDKMDEAASRLDYEKASMIRDQIQGLQHIQTTQVMDVGGGDVDAIGLAMKEGTSCIETIFIRKGSVLGNRHFFQDIHLDESKEEVLNAFLSQFYVSHADRRDFPKEIILPFDTQQVKTLQALVDDLSPHKTTIKIMKKIKSERKLWLAMAEKNATHALAGRLSDKKTLQQRFVSLQESLFLEKTPVRIECFDISHTQGQGTVASCVVFNQNGPMTELYRRFNIQDITPGDDYAAMKQAVTRRYLHLSSNPDPQSVQNKKENKISDLPDMLLIDGGHGQLGVVREALDELNITLPVYGIAKGLGRKAGLETIIHMQTGREFQFDITHPGLLLLLQARDEAHRFALKGHRKIREKAAKTSSLEKIPGIGPKRRSGLIRFFGGLQGVRKATISDIAKVPGISEQLAEDIYNALHG